MVRIAWNLSWGGTKKSTRYQVLYPVEKKQKWTVLNRTVPYHAVEKRHKKTICNTLRCEGLKSCSARKVPLLKKAHVQARLKFTNDSEENWLKCWGQMRPKSSSLASTVFGGGGMLPMTPRTPSPQSNMEVETLCFGGQGIENGLWMGISTWQWPKTHGQGNKGVAQKEAH